MLTVDISMPEVCMVLVVVREVRVAADWSDIRDEPGSILAAIGNLLIEPKINKTVRANVMVFKVVNNFLMFVCSSPKLFPLTGTGTYIRPKDGQRNPSPVIWNCFHTRD